MCFHQGESGVAEKTVLKLLGFEAYEVHLAVLETLTNCWTEAGKNNGRGTVLGWMVAGRGCSLVECWVCHAAKCRFSSPLQQGIFLPESAFSAVSLTAFAKPLCAVRCMNICVHITNPIGSHTIVWTLKNTAHTRSNPGDGMWMPKWQGIENGRMCNVSPEKRMYYLLKKRNAEKKNTGCHSLGKPTYGRVVLYTQIVIYDTFLVRVSQFMTTFACHFVWYRFKRCQVTGWKALSCKCLTLKSCKL